MRQRDLNGRQHSVPNLDAPRGKSTRYVPFLAAGVDGVHGSDRGRLVQERDQQRLGGQGLESFHGRGQSMLCKGTTAYQYNRVHGCLETAHASVQQADFPRTDGYDSSFRL